MSLSLEVIKEILSLQLRTNHRSAVLSGEINLV